MFLGTKILLGIIFTVSFIMLHIGVSSSKYRRQRGSKSFVYNVIMGAWPDALEGYLVIRRVMAVFGWEEDQ